MNDVRDSLALGVDLGGTKIEIALVDCAGKVVDRTRLLTQPDQGAEAVLAEVGLCLTERYLKKSGGTIFGLGIGVAGQVDPESGLVRYAPNLRWHNTPVRQQLEDRLGVPVVVMNDVQAVTYGEWIHGAGQNIANLVCLFIGTGVGGGIVADGRLLIGCSGNAGELGHLTIDRNGPQCSCGSHGCLEALVGGWAIARLARKRVETEGKEGAGLRWLAGGSIESITAEVVGEGFRQGDPLARQLVEEVGQALGVGLTSIANAFNPELIILGGGVLEGLPELLDFSEREMRARALEAASRPLRIVRAALGPDAGAVGAATRARDKIIGKAAGNSPQ